MGTARIKIKYGDIFKVKISDNEVCYLQYLANDINQLNGDVIRVFKDRYKDEDTPSPEEVINGEIDFYCHVFLKRGVQLGFWTQYAHSDNVGDLKKVYFKNYIDALPWSTYWYAWNIYDSNPKEYKKLPRRFQNAFWGTLFQPSTVFHKITTGRFYERKNIADGDPI